MSRAMGPRSSDFTCKPECELNLTFEGCADLQMLKLGKRQGLIIIVTVLGRTRILFVVVAVVITFNSIRPVILGNAVVTSMTIVLWRDDSISRCSISRMTLKRAGSDCSCHVDPIAIALSLLLHCWHH